MKITIMKKDSDRLAFENLAPGTVYQIGCGVTLLKLTCNKAIALEFSRGDDWFTMARPGEGNFEGRRATKILGKLTEIIVDPDI